MNSKAVFGGVLFLKDGSFCILGGDQRMLFLADFLKENNQQVFLAGFDRSKIGAITKEALWEAIQVADTVILPIPLTKDGTTLHLPNSSFRITLSDLKEFINGKRCFGGGDLSECEGYTDLLKEEWLTVHNAELTAQGAIARALANGQRSLSDSTVLVAGFGRIGKQLARILRPMCRNLYVSARKAKDRAEIESMGYRFVSTQRLSEKKELFDIVFSTIPTKIFDQETLACAKPKALLIDLASAQGSIEKTAAQQLNLQLIHALSIPGKDFPKTAGKLLGQTILQFCQGESV